MPKYALIEVNGGFVVEPFDANLHMQDYYCGKRLICRSARPAVTLFRHQKEVAHLRHQILN